MIIALDAAGRFRCRSSLASSAAIGQSVGISPPAGELGDILGQLPGQVFDALPMW